MGIYKYITNKCITNKHHRLFEELINRETPILPEKNRKRVELFLDTFKWLLEYLPVKPRRNWIVFEAGDGRYGWSDLYLHFFDKVYGGDIEDFSKFHPGVFSIQCDFSKSIPLSRRSIDIVVSHSVLEHLTDISAVLSNLDRILKVGGYIYLTVSPLYYSAEGAHINNPYKLSNWEHLDPSSEHYLQVNPMVNRISKSKGHELNKMTFDDFLGYVSEFPWSIIGYKLMIDRNPIPGYVEWDKWSEMDLMTKGFRFLFRKEGHFKNGIPSTLQKKLASQIRRCKEDWYKGIMAQNKSLKDVKSLYMSLNLFQFDYDFLDFGSSEGESISFAIQHLGGTQGIGIEIDPKKVIEARQRGYECIQGDFTQLVFPPDSVRFVTMNHVLEHLSCLSTVKRAIESAARVASDFLFIIGPYFDTDQFLKNCGLKFFWSDWTGHKCLITTQQLQEILMDLGLKDYVMMVRKIVKDSSDSAIHPLNSPKDQHEYNAEVHPEKPFVIFNQPIYKEIVCYVRLRPLKNWEDIINAVEGTI